MAKFTSDTAKYAAQKANAVLNTKGTRHRFTSDSARKAREKRFDTTPLPDLNQNVEQEKVVQS